MSKRNILANLMFAAVCIVTGCQHKETTTVLDREPNFQVTYIPSGYQSQAIEAAGGMYSWAKVTKLPLDSVVTFYQGEWGD